MKSLLSLDSLIESTQGHTSSDGQQAAGRIECRREQSRSAFQEIIASHLVGMLTCKEQGPENKQ